jgi:predicted RNase H-like nuclease (RuvC/YqgF family)
MSDEPHKLVAKIQHFYDIMVNTAEELEDHVILVEKHAEKSKTHEKSVEIRKLISEYDKVFAAFLYKEQV